MCIRDSLRIDHPTDLRVESGRKQWLLEDKTLLNVELANDRRQAAAEFDLDDLVKNIDANVVIDYAHNPDAFSVLLTENNRNFKDLVVVFGCGGERDKYKRPIMLKIATNIATKVIFTSDNSRDEDFKDIFKVRSCLFLD